MATISLVSNHKMRLSGIGEVTWGMTLSDIRIKIDNELPVGAKITNITLNFSGKSYNNNILKAYNEYVHCALTDLDSEAASNNEGGTGDCTNLFVYGPYEISGRGTTTLPNKSVSLKDYFNEFSPYDVQNTTYSRLTIAFTSKAVYNKDETFSLSLDVTYEIPTYTITWKNFDGKGGTKTTTVNRGTIPSYSGTPSKAADTKKEYTFSGWSPSIVAATGDATYTAQFTESPRTYYVFIENPSGNCETNFITQKYKYGDTITLNAYNFAEHTEFKLWRSNNGTKDWYSNPQTVILNEELITHCLSSSGNIGFFCYTKFKTYTIKADIQPNSNAGFVQHSYYIDGVWYDGNAVTVPNEGISFTYGDSNYGSAFKATANEGYKFSKWSDGVTDNPRNIDTSRNITYTAIFEKLTFTATFKNYDGNVLQTIEVEYGDIPKYTGSTPTKPNTAEYSYSFSGWSPSIGAITSDTTYIAQFSSTKIKYTIYFVNYDNSPLESKEVEYGVIPTYTGATPKKPSDAQYDYVFSTWSPSIVAVTGTATYKAVFNSVLKYYTVLVTDGVINLISGNLIGGKYSYGSVLKIIANEKAGYKFVNWSGNSNSNEKEIPYTVTGNASFVANYRRLQMKFKSVKILHHSTNEVASPTNPLIGGEDGDQAIVQVKIALE